MSLESIPQRSFDPTSKIGKKPTSAPTWSSTENVEIGDQRRAAGARSHLSRSKDRQQLLRPCALDGARKLPASATTYLLQNGVVIGADGFGFAKTNDGHWHKIPQPGPVVIEDDVEIQANSCIDRASVGETRIGAALRSTISCR